MKNLKAGLILLIAVALFSCGDDDEPPPGGGDDEPIGGNIIQGRITVESRIRICGSNEINFFSKPLHNTALRLSGENGINFKTTTDDNGNYIFTDTIPLDLIDGKEVSISYLRIANYDYYGTIDIPIEENYNITRNIIHTDNVYENRDSSYVLEIDLCENADELILTYTIENDSTEVTIRIVKIHSDESILVLDRNIQNKGIHAFNINKSILKKNETNTIVIRTFDSTNDASKINTNLLP